MVRMKVNGEAVSVDAKPETPLLWVIREKLNLTGTKFGCGIAQCGACTVHLNGQPVRSCSLPVSAAEGKDITTVEGLTPADGTLSVLQDSFCEAHGLQCGYCTPGMLIASQALLNATPNPSEEQIRDAIGGNLCRCTGYRQIVDAVKLAAGRLAEQK